MNSRATNRLKPSFRFCKVREIIFNYLFFKAVPQLYARAFFSGRFCKLFDKALVVALARGALAMCLQNVLAISLVHFSFFGAILNYAREEIRLKSEYVEPLMDIVSKIPNDTKDYEISVLKKDVIELHQKMKSEPKI